MRYMTPPPTPDDRLLEGLAAAVERGALSWPLPMPPIQDADFPILPPSSPEHVVERAKALFISDPHGVNRHLREVVDTLVPHRTTFLDRDDDEALRKAWKRSSTLIEHVLFRVCTDWMVQALDAEAPDDERWFSCVALLAGLSTRPSGPPVHMGYHMVESMAIAAAPGSWHGGGARGPHQIDFNPTDRITSTDLIPHELGGQAANWLLDRLEGGSTEQQELLVEILQLLLERPGLIERLEVLHRLVRLSAEGPEVAVRVLRAAARMLDVDIAAGRETLNLLAARSELEIRRTFADVQTRLFRRLGKEGLPFFEAQLADSDDDVQAAASATVKDLKFLDPEMFRTQLAKLVDHPHVNVRRNVVQALRDYLNIFPDDPEGLVARLWADPDELARGRLRELMLRMEELTPSSFSTLGITVLKDDATALDSVFEILDHRRPERVVSWKLHFFEDGPLPDPVFVDPVDTAMTGAEFLVDGLDGSFNEE